MVWEAIVYDFRSPLLVIRVMQERIQGLVPLHCIAACIQAQEGAMFYRHGTSSVTAKLVVHLTSYCLILKYSHMTFHHVQVNLISSTLSGRGLFFTDHT